MLSTHYKVKDATSAYNKMIKRSQKPDESVMKFVQEMTKLRTQILRLSQAEGGHYTRKLLQTEFQRAVYNGLRQNDVRQSLRLTLKREDLSDNDLCEEISELMLNEADHESKLEAGKTTKSASVKQVDFNVKPKKEKDDNIMVHVIQKLDDFKVGVSKDLADFKTDILNQVAPAINSNPQQQSLGNGNIGLYASGYNFPQYAPFAGYPVGYGNNGGFGGGYSHGGYNANFGGGRGGGRAGQNRGRGGGRNGFSGHGGGNNNGGRTLKKLFNMCDVK